MKPQGTILLFLISVVLLSATVKKNTPDFKLVSATKMVTMGGAAGSPTITQFNITLKALRSFTFCCDSAFGEGRMDRLTIKCDTSNTLQKKKIRKGQLIHLSFSIVQASDNGNNNTGLQFSSSPEVSLPISSKTGVVLRYCVNQKKYFNITSVNTQLPVYAP